MSPPFSERLKGVHGCEGDQEVGNRISKGKRGRHEKRCGAQLGGGLESRPGTSDEGIILQDLVRGLGFKT